MESKSNTKMTSDQEQIKQFLDSLPESLQIHEEGVKIEIQKEYLEYSESFERGKLADEQIATIGHFLFNTEAPCEGKKKALTVLAHVGTIEVCRLLKKFYENADGELKQWASLALQECKMFLESELLVESMGFISTGLGGENDKLRVYLLLLPLINNEFNKQQHKVIENELSQTAKDLNCDIESFDFQKNHVGLIALIPTDVAIATLVDTGIQSCNEFGDFVIEHYYAANTEIPDEEEIKKIIEIVRND